MIDVQFGELREHFTAESEMGRTMNDFSDSWTLGPVGNGIWSSKNSLFMDYNGLSSSFGPSLLKLAELKRLQQIGRDNSVQHSCSNDVLPATSDNSVASPKADSDTMSDFSSPSPSRLSPLDLSMAKYDDASNDSLLKTPAGFYDKSHPFSGPSIPPLFERDETCYSDVSRSRRASVESLSASSQSDDSASMCSDYHRQRLEEWLNEESKTLKCSANQYSAVEQQDCVSSNRLLTPDDETQLCDRLVCSVLSQVISDDISTETCLFSTDIETKTSDYTQSECSHASSPGSKSALNPLAPSFRVKPSSSKSVVPPRMARVTSHRPAVYTVCSPVPFSYMQPHSPHSVAWGYVPAYCTQLQSSSSSDLPKTKAAVMYYTPLQDGTGIWTQYSDASGACGYPTVFRSGSAPYKHPICLVPQPCVGFVKLGYQMAMPVTSPLNMTRKSRSATVSNKRGRGCA